MRKYFYLYLFAIGIICTPRVSAQDWFDNMWSYRIPLHISNPSLNGGLSNYNVKISLGETNFDFSKCSPAGNDLRFTDSDGKTILNYYIETFIYPDTAVIWVKIPYLAAGSSKTIYLYSGNVSAPDLNTAAGMFRFYDDFESFQTMNAANYLNTPTYYGAGEAVHPDVLYFADGWKGYKYWMAMTPYPKGVDDFENPSMLVSQDGMNWSVPPGLTNPIVPMPAAPGWNNDPDILVVNDTMHVYFNESNPDSNTYVKHMTSADGIHWSLPQTVFSFPYHLMSPAFIYEDSTYYVWYVRSKGCYDNKSSLYMRTSADGINWGPEQSVNISQPDKVIWHINVIRDGTKYIMLLATYPVYTSDCAKTSLYYGESTDKINWQVNDKPILSPSFDGWDNFNIYRVSFIKQDSLLRIWYSGRNKNRNWHIAYTEGTLQKFLMPHQWDQLQGSVKISDTYHKGGAKALRLAGSSPAPRVAKQYNGQHSYNVWLYDNMTTDTLSQGMFRIFDNVSSRSIGVGLAVNKSAGYYVYHTAGLVYTISNIKRSLGWHKFEIKVRSSTSDIFIDDQFITSLDVLNESLISKFYLEGSSGGEAIFDNCYVRDYAAEEPAVTAGKPDGRVAISAKVFLEGPYDLSKGEMSSIHGSIPLSSPYSESPRTVSAIPDSVTDWVLLQFKTSDTSAPVFSYSAFLNKNGRIVSDDGSTDLTGIDLIPGSYYLKVKHRNHLAVMSALPVVFSSSASLFDFTSSAAAIYGAEAGELKLENGIYAMAAGDCNGDGIINGSDFNDFFLDFYSSASGYLNTDMNMDTYVTGADFNYFNVNFLHGLATKVP